MTDKLSAEKPSTPPSHRHREQGAPSLRERVVPWLAALVGMLHAVRSWATGRLLPTLAATGAGLRDRSGPALKGTGRTVRDGFDRAEGAAVPWLRRAGRAVLDALGRAEAVVVPWLRDAAAAAAVAIDRGERVAVRALRRAGQTVLFAVDRAEVVAVAALVGLVTTGGSAARRRGADLRARRAASREPGDATGAAATATSVPGVSAPGTAEPATVPSSPDPVPAPSAAAFDATAPVTDPSPTTPSAPAARRARRPADSGPRGFLLSALVALGLAAPPAAAPAPVAIPGLRPRPGAEPRPVPRARPEGAGRVGAPPTVPPAPVREERRPGVLVEDRRLRPALLAAAGALATVGVTAVILNLIAPSILRPVLASTGGAVDVEFVVPDEAALPALAQRSVMYAADGSVLAVLHDEVDRRIVSLGEIPPHVRQAVITAEDRKFYEHRGYDVEGIGRAAVANLQSQSISQGASTIPQQLAKTIVGDEDSLDRKIQELAYAIALEDEFSKDELLERYLNEVYFGGGAYGIAAAAESFFGVGPEQLSVAQAATLAGQIRAPGSGDPRRNPDIAQQRRDNVIRVMEQDGYITEEQAADALATPLEVRPPPQREQQHPYVVAAIIDEFIRNPAFGESRAERYDALYSGGLRIHTTVDPRLQEIADRVVRETLGDGGGPTAAIAAVDPRNGRVVAIHGGSDFESERFNLATQGRRQPGSAFKPFVVATALEQGYPVSTTLDGAGPKQFDVGSREPYEVQNFGNASYGRVDLRQTLVNSVNTASVQLGLMVGPENVAELAGRLGINTEAAMGGVFNPAMALGGLTYGVTPLEMASAYGVIANQGNRATPHLIDRVQTAAGGDVFTFEPNPQRVLSPSVDGAMVSIMRDIVSQGTGTRAQIPGWQVGGKTGTTQNSADAWFVGYTPIMSTAVWMGHPEGQIPMGSATGGRLPALMWNRFMSEALAGREPVGFAPLPQGPDGGSGGGEVDVPDVVGADETQAMAALGGSQLVAQVSEVASASPRGRVVWQSPRPETSASSGQTITLGVSTGIAPAPEPAQAPEPQPVSATVEDAPAAADADEPPPPPEPRG